jgi:hypothetical protein
MVRSWCLVALVSIVVAGCGGKVLDHFQCYVVEGESASPPEVLQLKDQFRVKDNVRAVKVRYFCNPVMKVVNGAEHKAQRGEDHLTCYLLEPKDRFEARVEARNQFGETRVVTSHSELLCVPTHKVRFQATEEPKHCPGDKGCCCNMADGQGGTWPDCQAGFECRRQVNTTDPNQAIQVCVPVSTPANAPLELHGSQPPFCRLPEEPGPHCPGKTGCCCNMPNAAGTLWPACDAGFECRREPNPSDPNRAIQVCVPNGTPANAPLELHGSQPPFCR